MTSAQRCAHLLWVFGEGVSKMKFLVVRALCSQVRFFLPSEGTGNGNFDTKRPFQNAFSFGKGA